MDDSLSIASSPTAMRQENIGLQVQMGVLKKSIDSRSSEMAKLLESIPSAPINPPHLGNKVDFSA